VLPDRKKSSTDFENYELILFLDFLMLSVSTRILSFVFPFPVLVHHELLARILNRLWQEAVNSCTLSNIEAFQGKRPVVLNEILHS
jgi:hypothetical protein